MGRDTVPLRIYMESLINNIKESVSLAYLSMEKRLESMNEFRDTLKDQASRFVTRDEMTAKIEILDKQVDDLRMNKATLDGKASQQSVTMAFFISSISIALGIIGIIINFIK